MASAYPAEDININLCVHVPYYLRCCVDSKANSDFSLSSLFDKSTVRLKNKQKATINLPSTHLLNSWVSRFSASQMPISHHGAAVGDVLDVSL